MSELLSGVRQMQKLIGDAAAKTDALAMLAESGKAEGEKTRRMLEQTMEEVERATLELRRLCEQIQPSAVLPSRRPALPCREVTGYVENLNYGWLHICLHTLLPSCRYLAPVWLADTVKRLLDDYESGGSPLPYYREALMVIDEHSDVQRRQVFDQDNKGWKAISNAIKGRLIPDDDQYTLGVALLSTRSKENVCHITFMDRADAADFFSYWRATAMDAGSF